MGGRTSNSGMGQQFSAGPTAQDYPIKGGENSGNFAQVTDGRWESEVQTYDAAVLTGPDRHLIGSKSSKFYILRGTLNGREVYRSYQQRMGRSEFLHRSSSLEEAIKKINK